MPAWVPDAVKMSGRRLYFVLVGAALTVVAVLWLLGQLTSFLTTIGMALFLSFALEPAVDWFAKRGWKRGMATGLIFVILLLAMVLLAALIVPAVVSGFKQLVVSAPSLVDTLAGWLRHLGFDLSTENLITE